MTTDPEETIIEEHFSRAFTTAPKIRRHLNGMTPTRKRAALLMELLFQNGYIKEAPYEAIRQFITDKADFIGLDNRTVTTYIGRPKTTKNSNQNPKTTLTISYLRTGTVIPKEYSSTQALPEKQGICHQLGYMTFDYRIKSTMITFNHEKVPLPYHLKPTYLDSEKKKHTELSKDDLRAQPIPLDSQNTTVHIETYLTENRERRDSKQHTQISSNPENQSIYSQQENMQVAWLTPSQKATTEERDRKKLQIIHQPSARATFISAKLRWLHSTYCAR